MIKNGFIIIDRIQLDKIRLEQNFQLSREVEDETAVSIGKLVGADIIITGSITRTGALRRLCLRALNTQSAQVMAVASEQL
jgi:curli biogenesis system outer membrane secretion channel CsgG